MDPSLRIWLWIIEYLVSNRDLPFSVLGGIIDNIPFTLDDFPSHIRERLALRCLEELAGKDCGETSAAEATKATSTLDSSGKIDVSQTCEEVLLKLMQKNLESSQPNASYSKECNNLPEVSRPCVNHDTEKFTPTKKYASPQPKELNLIRKYLEFKNLANTPFKSVGGESQNDFNILQNLAEQNSLDDIQIQKATVDGTCEVSKDQLQAEERKNLPTSDVNNDLISLQNEISVLNTEAGCHHSAKRKALSSKISARFAKRNKREKAVGDDNYHGVIENKRADRSYLKRLRKRRNRQTLWTAKKRSSRRSKLFWKPEEEEVLKKVMQKSPQNDDGSISWVKILEYCRPVLHESRTPIDLKDKWRNMEIREAKNRG